MHARYTCCNLLLDKSVAHTFDVPVEQSTGGEVWKTQSVRNFRSADELRHFPRAFELFREHDVNSFCVFPLTSAHRRVGALGFGRAEEGGYSEKELEFGKLVAAQVAVALDNALHYDEALLLQKELARERDRLRLVLEVNNSVVSNLELRDLFHAISTSLRRLISHDSATLLLPDPHDRGHAARLCAGFSRGPWLRP